MYDITERIELLILETAEEYIKRKKEEKRERDKATFLYKMKIEKEAKGLCECGNEHPRWVDNYELYMCAECFIQGLQCQGDVMVPTRGADQVDGYDEYCCWDDLWEEENRFYKDELYYYKGSCLDCDLCDLNSQNNWFCEHWNSLLEVLSIVELRACNYRKG